MADTTNWKLEGDIAQCRTLYLEHNDRDIYTHTHTHTHIYIYIYIYKMPKCNSDTTVQSSVFFIPWCWKGIK